VANIQKRPDGRWRARYRDNPGQEHARHFKRKIDAQRWLDDITTAVTTGTYVDPSRGRVAVGEWAQTWLLRKVDPKPTTRRGYASAIRTHIDPRWATVKLIDITHAAVAAWVAGLTELGLSASTRHAHRVLSLILDLAMRDGRLARNPAQRVPLPRLGKHNQIYLDHADVDALADAAGEYRLVILFLAYTGVRYGEMAALRVRNLDLLRRRVSISEAVADVSGHAVFGTPKNHQQRSAPVSRFLVEDLAQHVAFKQSDDFVFAADRGGLLHLRNFRRDVFDPAVRAAGLDGLTPHALRHTAAGSAIASGANVKVVQTMLGHYAGDPCQLDHECSRYRRAAAA